MQTPVLFPVHQNAPTARSPDCACCQRLLQQSRDTPQNFQGYPDHKGFLKAPLKTELYRRTTRLYTSSGLSARNSFLKPLRLSIACLHSLSIELFLMRRPQQQQPPRQPTRQPQQQQQQQQQQQRLKKLLLRHERKTWVMKLVFSQLHDFWAANLWSQAL